MKKLIAMVLTLALGVSCAMFAGAANDVQGIVMENGDIVIAAGPG